MIGFLNRDLCTPTALLPSASHCRCLSICACRPTLSALFRRRCFLLSLCVPLPPPPDDAAAHPSAPVLLSTEHNANLTNRVITLWYRMANSSEDQASWKLKGQYIWILRL